MASPLTPDTVLRDRYCVEDLVGQGGMGAVYRARDLRLPGRLCAVKEVLPTPGIGEDPDQRQAGLDQFRREAETLARLDHPNLPKVSDVFSEGGREYLIMDFVAGPSLSEVLRQRRMDAREAGISESRTLAWADQLLEALAYLHGQSPAVLHGDIKPANIILAEGGLLKLVDFGLVRLQEQEDQQTVTVVQGRGTLAYTPLERYGGDSGRSEPAADIYSLGATLYHLLAGEPPPDARARFLEAGQLPTLQRVRRDVSSRTEAALFQAMALHPDQRFKDASAFRKALLDPGKRTPAAGGTGWSTALTRNVWLLAGALALLAAGLLASLLWGPPLPPGPG